MTIKAVIFDIGNVLIEWQPERFFDRVVGEDRRRAMFAAVDLHGMNDRVDRGETFRDVIYDTATAYPEFEAEIRIWHDRWIEMAAPAIPHSVRLLRALRTAGVPVYALTNFGIQTFDVAEPVYPFLGEFERRYISGHMGVIKPDADIYAQLEADVPEQPDTLLFADDRQENLDAAAARGWHTHLFDHPAGWADRLVAEGLLTQEQAQ
ncbi:HAD family phosphatase [Thalassobium sp. R2A62]|jgi:2-haloacid dehalogenase|uniref:HAD family hydrolase n=1 Tax=Thalassobium sp. R2A62 TaxID=633131 RepID=UPI0001B1D1F3|nr:HAD family phosphatase [Thalassobium sp. R2A62]EET48125.1 HAD-superfamily hydrolase subfamily IA, variant 3 [Thalassobium sp. R2A62]MDG1339928.1 HAD family phosphatase [Paracoccaceae bacterium]MDG2451681.1 HAD family phosphatase [Paracoccaceae bacterium]